MPDFYATARAIDPSTGDVRFDDAVSGWEHQHPTAWLIASVLRTMRGAAKRDPSFGVDWASVRTQTPSAKAQAEAAIRVALDRYVRRGQFVLLAVEADVAGSTLLARVTFRDPRDTTARSVRQRVAL